MSNTINISFILPCYNVGKYIETCLNSIYNQDVAEDKYEVICVNDCSTDNTVEIINQYRKTHGNLFLINQPRNMQQGAARNAGLEYSKGEYVWFVDADDFIQPGVLNKIISLAFDNEVDILHFNVQRVDGDGNFQEYYANFPFNTEVISGIDYYEYDYPYWKRLIEMWCRIYKRDFLIKNKILFPMGIYFEDAVFTLKTILLSKRFQYLNETVYNYRINPESSTMTKDIQENGRKMADLIRFHLDCIAEVERHDLNIKTKNEIQSFYLNLFLRNRINVFYLTNLQRKIFYSIAKDIKFEIMDRFISPKKYIIYTNSTFLKIILNIISPPLRFLRIAKRRLYPD